MDRREFLKGVGTVSAASLATFPFSKSSTEGTEIPSHAAASSVKPKTWQFWDLWHLDRISQLALKQGQAEWDAGSTYVDPLMYGHNMWPTVYRDEATNSWRMLYSVRWKPFTLMLAESDDGMHWRPSVQPNVKPPGDKLAAHHLYTLDSGSAGGVYVDPIAADGNRFKVYVHQQQEAVYQRALKDANHPWHSVAKAEGNKRYLNDEFLLVSPNGLDWKMDLDGRWSSPDWHPEPPIFGFYNHHQDRHAMTVRPGWGDRRVCLQSTENFRSWNGPELLFQPDALDPPLEQHYGMPVFPCGSDYVGLLWVFHCADIGPLRGFNQFQGPIDCQFTYSYDGVRFFRGHRAPLVTLNEPDEHGCAVVQPSSLVEVGDEIRIYSGGGKIMHGMSRSTPNARERELFSILLHRLRKDGFTYLQPEGNEGEFLSKPFALFDGQLTANLQAPYGEARWQLTDMESRPIEGFTFDDCIPFKAGDSTNHSLQWRAHFLSELVGKVLRLEVKLRDARLYSLRGAYHFLDAQDHWMLHDEKPIEASMFDF